MPTYFPCIDYPIFVHPKIISFHKPLFWTAILKVHCLLQVPVLEALSEASEVSRQWMHTHTRTHTHTHMWSARVPHVLMWNIFKLVTIWLRDWGWDSSGGACRRGAGIQLGWAMLPWLHAAADEVWSAAGTLTKMKKDHLTYLTSRTKPQL